MLKPFQFNDIIINVVDVLHAEHPTDWVYAEHRDVWFEFCYVCKGRVYTNVDGKEYGIGAGEAYIVPPMVPHSHRNFDNIGDDGYCIRFSINKAETKTINGKTLASAQDILKELKTVRPYAFPFNGEEFMNSLEDLSEFLIQLKFVQFLINLCEAHNDQNHESGIVEDEDDLLSQKIIFFMQEFHGADFSVVEMAKSFHLSYRHLSRIFRKATGMTITNKLNEIRIEHAKRLLRDTNMLLKDIAEKIGLENQYYFSKMFRDHENKTPTKYRVESRKTQK
jgi:AraC-like DNA-binding protein